MAVTDIAKLRLINQHIAGTVLETPEDMVGWMGAMQAQDYGMAKWGLGVRLPGSTEYEVEEAINDGRILRTHILRPTWHLVAATDLAWMMNLTGPRIKSGLNGNNKRLGLTEEDLVRYFEEGNEPAFKKRGGDNTINTVGESDSPTEAEAKPSGDDEGKASGDA